MINNKIPIPFIYPFMLRVLMQLYDKPQTIHELNESAKVQNSADAVKKLRDKGINIVSEWIINPVKENRRSIVKYFIHPESKKLALKTINKNR